MLTSSDIKYAKLSEIESVLQSPDMYFGDIKVNKYNDYVYNPETNKIEKQKNIISQVLLKMTDEILMNCSDNYIRSMKSKNKMTYIKVNINKDKRAITIKNDGLSISIKKNKEHDLYIPQMVFSSLFSSSNFTKERTGAGKNGVGASITNIMSLLFKIDIVCDEKRYKQTFSKNCKEISEPEITDTEGEDNYVKISFIPDMKRIIKLGLSKDSELNELEQDEKEALIFENTLPYIYRRVLDVAVSLYDSSNTNFSVYLNGEELNGVSLIEYAGLLLNKEPDESNFLEFTNNNLYDIIIYKYPNDRTQKTVISFVNNINVIDGVHVSKILKQISAYVIKKLKLNKDDKEKAELITERSLSLFIKCNLINPLFEGQGKTKLQNADNIDKIKLTPSDLEEIYNNIDFETLVNGQNIADINKNMKTKKNERLLLDKLCDAELAGTKESKKCTLFLCEGDSAAKLAKDGITQLGHDKFGVFPLGGKPINATKASLKDLGDNRIVINLTKILGLSLRTHQQIKEGVQLDLSKLRYGHIVMLKDADTDGAHIMALTINLIQELYPELLKIDGFFNEFITPMIKLIIPNKLFKKLDIDLNDKEIKSNAGTIIQTKKNTIYPFYNTDAYIKFINEHPECKHLQPIYVKGLGGHNDTETREYFRCYITNLVKLHMDKKAEKNLIIAFDQKKTDDRKKIIQSRTGEHSLPRFINTPIECSDFLNNDWIDYSYEACVRSVPSAIDGLKPSQRKILYVMLNNYKPGKSNTEENQDRFKKVFQICGEVAAKGYYHHGDQSLNQAIIKMAQDFSGSNNLPLLAYSGSFGSRDANGDDAGAPRYIGATIHEVARYIFPVVDDALLTPNIEDNNKVEPVYYVPIIPMLLINGSRGIGTGYSSTVLQYNPLTIIEKTKKYIKSKENGEDKDLTFKPHYNYFKGKIKKETDKKYIISSVYDIDKNVVNITEIPFTLPKQKFISNLKMLYRNGIITDWSEEKTRTLNEIDIYVYFVIDDDDAKSVSSKKETSDKKIKKEQNKKKEQGKKKFKEVKDKKVSLPIYDDDGNLDKDYVEKVLLLNDYLSINNMNAFNSKCSLTEYNEVMDLYKEWYKVRENLYIKRKETIVKNYEHQILLISEKARFVKLVVDEKLIINKRPKQDIIEDLREKFEFKVIDNDENYGYLLNIPVISLTKEKYEELINKLEDLKNELETLNNTKITDIWIDELDKLEDYINDNYDVDEW